jgi:hypothetical protein
MSKISKLVTQGGADTFTSASILTGLTADGKAGWSISSIRAYWVDFAAVAAADYGLSAILATIATATTFGDDDEIDRLSWGCQNTAGVAVAIPVNPLQEHFLAESRITVQPELYVAIASAGTAQANDVIIEVVYEVVKMSDLEVLRLLAGGA